MTYHKEFDFCKPYMVDDEYILWQGRPGEGNLLTKRDVTMIPFSIVWCAFAIFWTTSVLQSGAPVFMALFGMVFVAIGLYMVFGRFIHTSYMRKRTAYVITNKKIIRIRGNNIDMQSGVNLPPMRIEVFKNGNGTLSFGDEYVYTEWNKRRYNTNQFTLENIPDPARVQQIIQQMEK